MKGSIFLVLAFLSISNYCFGQTDGGRVTDSKINELKPGIYMYQSMGGNIGLFIGNDGVLMIDDQFEEVSEDLLKDLKRLTKKPLKFVINTHHHGDHTGGNAKMVEAGATIVAHQNVRATLKKYIEDNPSKKIDERILPQLTFMDELSFFYNGEEIKLKSIEKSHTNGDIIVFFSKSNVLHTGDCFVQNRYPFIDSENGGSLEGYVNGLETILTLINRDTKIIPGHGDESNLQDVREQMRMMGLVWKRVAYLFLQGKSEAEIVSMTSFTKEYDEKGYGDHLISREKFLKSVYDEVAIKYDQNDYQDQKDMIEKIKKDQKEGN